MEMFDTSNARGRILAAAFQTVGQYGFRRTSMDDIAKHASMSRPALYQHFSNKADIYRAVLQQVADAFLAAMNLCLANDEALDIRLETALRKTIVEPLKLVDEMPHGSELLDLSQEIGADIMEDWYQRKRGLIASALTAEVNGDNELADDLSHFIVSSLEGMKARRRGHQAMDEEISRLVRVAIRAIGG